MQVDPTNTYLVSRANSAAREIPSDLKQMTPNSTILKMEAIINEMLPIKSKNQPASSIQWRCEKEKLLRILTSEGPDTTRNRSRIESVSETLQNLMDKLINRDGVRWSKERMIRDSVPSIKRNSTKFHDIQNLLDFTEHKVRFQKLRQSHYRTQNNSENSLESSPMKFSVSEKWKEEKEKLLSILTFSGHKPLRKLQLLEKVEVQQTPATELEIYLENQQSTQQLYGVDPNYNSNPTTQVLQQNFQSVVSYEQLDCQQYLTFSQDKFTPRLEPVKQVQTIEEQIQKHEEDNDQDLLLINNIRQARLNDGIVTIMRRLNALKKLIVVKAFYLIKESLQLQKKKENRLKAIRKLFVFFRSSINTHYTQFIIFLQNPKQSMRKKPELSGDLTLSLEDFSKIQQVPSRENETQLSCVLFQKQPSPNAEENFNYFSEFTQKNFLMSQQSQKSPVNKQSLQLKLQQSAVHQYAISKNEHTPIKTEIFLFKSCEAKQMVTEKSSSKKTTENRGSNSVRTNQSLEQRSRYTSNYSQSREAKSQPVIPKKDVKQMLAEISTPITSNNARSDNERIRENANAIHTQQSKLESPGHKIIQRNDFHEVSPIADPKELDYPCDPVRGNSINKQALIVNSFTNFLKSRQQAPKRPLLPVQSISPQRAMHQVSRSQAQEKGFVGHKRQMLSDNYNFINSENHTLNQMSQQNSSNANSCNHFAIQKARIGKKFQQLTKPGLNRSKATLQSKENILDKKNQNFDEFSNAFQTNSIFKSYTKQKTGRAFH